MNNALSKAEQRLNDINHNIEVAKQELHLSPKISDSLIVESIGTMGQIKSNDQYIDELNSKRHQVVSDLEAFYNHAEAVTNYSYDASSQLSDKTTAQLNEENQLLAQQVDQYNEQYLDMQSEVSDLNAQINHMETDTTLTQLRHEYHSLKNRMNSIAKDWASLSYLQSLVDEHIKQIKDKRLPQVINEAILIFTNLTNGAYTNIYYSEEAIQVKHENGQMYQPVELSQSTKELLYVALRLSLIKVLKPYYPFPIIVDDAFVHFDKDRKERMINYLRTLSTEHQVIYFTCTNDNIVPTKEMITLNKLEKGGK